MGNERSMPCNDGAFGRPPALPTSTPMTTPINQAPTPATSVSRRADRRRDTRVTTASMTMTPTELIHQVEVTSQRMPSGGGVSAPTIVCSESEFARTITHARTTSTKAATTRKMSDPRRRVWPSPTGANKMARHGRSECRVGFTTEFAPWSSLCRSWLIVPRRLRPTRGTLVFHHLSADVDGGLSFLPAFAHRQPAGSTRPPGCDRGGTLRPGHRVPQELGREARPPPSGEPSPDPVVPHWPGIRPMQCGHQKRFHCPLVHHVGHKHR